MPRCESCGSWADDDERFCQHCGVKLPDDSDDDRWEKSTVEGPTSDREHDPEEVRKRALERKLAVDEDLPAPEREPPLEFVLRHPLRRGRRPLLVSAGLLLAAVLVVPALVLAGYSYRLARSVVFAEELPPTYSDPGNLVIDGARLVIVSSLPALLWTIGTTLVFGGLLLVLPAAEGLVWMFVFLWLAGLLWFAGTYIVAFVGADSVVGAFGDGRARTLRSDPTFLRHWLVVTVAVVVVLVALTVVVGPLLVLLAAGVPAPLVLVLSPLSVVAAAVVLAYALLAGATYAGFVYYWAADRGLVSDPEDDPGMGPADLVATGEQ